MSTQIVGHETTLPTLIDRASAALISAKSSAEVLEARDMARVAYDAAKSAGRMARAKKAHEEVMAAVYRAQADALLIEARAKIRLADEYDAAQERGEVRANGGDKSRIPEGNSASVTDLGLTHKDIHEARKLRDAEAANPGKAERVLKGMADRGEEPTKAALRRELIDEPEECPPQFEPAAEPDPDAAERRKLAKLTPEALIDEVLGLRADLADAKVEMKKQADEIKALKAQVKDFDGDQAATIRRQAQIIRHKESEMYRANEKAAQALKQVYILKKRVQELENMGIAV